MRRNTQQRNRLFGSRKGNAIVESGLCFLVLMFIFIAIIEFGMGVYTYNFVSYAAREGTRYASSRGAQSPTKATSTTIETFVRQHGVALDTSKIDVRTTWNPNNNPGNTVTVKVTYPITPVVGLFLGSIDVWSESTMPIAQ
jgi:Flp pilus assembly protein TadG